MTIRRAILHIGTEKTGSTAIQDALVRHRDDLAARGFFYSVAAGPRSHVLLAAYAADDHVRDDVRRKRKVDSAEDLARLRETVAADLRAEVDTHPDAVFVYSDEHLHSRLISPRSVARLAALLRPLFDEIRVIVYLRRQDKLAVSRHSTMLKAGGTDDPIIDPAWAGIPFYDYWRLTRRWSDAFGTDALTVRRFEDDRLVGGSIVSDFAASTGLPDLTGGEDRANESLRPEYQVFLREMNARLPRFVDGRPNPERGDLDRLIYDLGRGRGAQPARAAARAFYAAFAESNECVRARYFPTDPTLFDEDFFSYPETEDVRDIDAAQAIDIIVTLWRQLMTERAQMLGERAGMLADIAAVRARAERAESAARGRAAPALAAAPIAAPTGAPRLFQYWNTEARPAVVDALMQGWAADPAFAYCAHTRDAALAMIRERFDARTLTAFDRARVPAMQADLFRLCALHAFGGIYIDADIENIGDNAFLLHRAGRGFLFHRRGNLANDIMVVHAPGDPAVAFALARALDNIESGTGANVWAMTGPGILTSEYNRRGPLDPLFAGFRFGDVVDVRQHVRFHWNLDYKSTEADWRSAAPSDLVAPSDAKP